MKAQNKQLGIFELNTFLANDEFYNTINLKNPALKKEKHRNGRQNQAVLDFFKANRGKKFTALEVNDRLHFHESSTRRACTDLSDPDRPKSERIEMLEERIMERYGKPNHLFTFKP